MKKTCYVRKFKTDILESWKLYHRCAHMAFYYFLLAQSQIWENIEQNES